MNVLIILVGIFAISVLFVGGTQGESVKYFV